MSGIDSLSDIPPAHDGSNSDEYDDYRGRVKVQNADVNVALSDNHEQHYSLNAEQFPVDYGMAALASCRHLISLSSCQRCPSSLSHTCIQFSNHTE